MAHSPIRLARWLVCQRITRCIYVGATKLKPQANESVASEVGLAVGKHCRERVNSDKARVCVHLCSIECVHNDRGPLRCALRYYRTYSTPAPHVCTMLYSQF